MRFKTAFVILFLGFFSAVSIYIYRGEIRDAYDTWGKRNLPQAQKNTEVNELSANTIRKETSGSPLPAEINLDVPFSSQAPFTNWDYPYKEACEEMSAILIHYFLEGKNITPLIADNEILKLVEWEKKRFGTYQDTDSAQTATILREYFGHPNVVVKYDITLDDIKKELASGRPVIMPFAGRLLGNPNYRAPGPLYHMLVVKGYTKDGKFITNDVGTRRGKDFIYRFETLLFANHDWVTSEITKGRRAMIVVYSSSEAAAVK